MSPYPLLVSFPHCFILEATPTAWLSPAHLLLLTHPPFSFSTPILPHCQPPPPVPCTQVESKLSTDCRWVYFSFALDRLIHLGWERNIFRLILYKWHTEMYLSCLISTLWKRINLYSLQVMCIPERQVMDLITWVRV